MQRYHELEDVRLAGGFLAVGSFDGVHRGHQALLGRMVSAARDEGRTATVLTFFPHPSVVLGRRRAPLYLTTPEERADLLVRLGIEVLITLPFSIELSRVGAEEFVGRLVRHVGLKALWAGPDFALGHNREGTLPYLAHLGQTRGFRVQPVPPLEEDGRVISSTRIRQALAEGDVIQAARCLGRPYRLRGVVVPGAGRGTGIGIPTANLRVEGDRALPARGVYATWAQARGLRHASVSNIGLRPTFEGQAAGLVIETHLLDFSGDLYGQEVSLDFVEPLRPERKFDSAGALIAQIHNDIQRARSVLA